nr:DUF748 domain-containing protein [uncultured Marinifilum sp.]
MKYLSRKKVIFLSFITVLVLFFFFLSSIVKCYIERNSIELIGRKLEVADLHFNYAKVSARVNGFKLFEQNSKKEFLSFNELYVNISPWKLISGEYSISQIYLDGLNISIEQSSNGFNFDDLLGVKNNQTVDSTDLNKEEASLKFSIHDIKFKNGYIAYHDKLKSNNLELNKINLELPLIAWNNKKSEMGVNFSLGKKGSVSINANVNHTKQRYAVNLGIASVDISPFVAYLKDYMLVSEVQGRLNTQIKIEGSVHNFMDVFLKGNTELNDFVLKDIEGNKFLASQSVIVELDSIDLSSSHYEIGKVNLTKPEVYAALFKEASNFESIFAPILKTDSVNIETDTSMLANSELFYSIDSVIINKGFVEFSDYTLNRKFVYDINDVHLNIGQITDKANSIPLDYSINLNKGGHSKGKMVFSLQNAHNFKFNGKLLGLELMSFSPYTEFYIARPITQGELNYDCSIIMKPKQLVNTNKINISEFDFGDKTDDPNALKVPVRLALYLLKDKNDQINFDLPVSGNPKDPDFKLGKIIWKTVMNFLIKTAAKPFSILGSLAGTNPESIEKMTFKFSQTELNDKEIKTLKAIKDIVARKPELKFSFTQETDIEIEKDILVISECSKQYFNSNEQQKLGVFGADFVAWAEGNYDFKDFNKQNDFQIALPLKEKCYDVLGKLKLNTLLDSVLSERNKKVNIYLKDSLQVPIENYEIKIADLRNLSNQQKKPKYRVEVSLK